MLETSALEARAREAADLLKALSNEHRLLVLCHLVASEEMSVSALNAEIPLSQSALSQHLAKLRDEGLVTYRREAQVLFYRIADPNAARLLALLQDIFCPELSGSSPKK